MDKIIGIKNPTVIYELLSDNLYRDKEGSIARELIGNAIDSIIQKKGFIEEEDLEIKIDERNQIITIKDYGLAMTDDQLENIYGNYLNSNKKGDNNLLGFYGIGSKSPFSLFNKFHIINCKDGVRKELEVKMVDKIPFLEQINEGECIKDSFSVILDGRFSREKLYFSDLVKNVIKYKNNVFFDKYKAVEDVYFVKYYNKCNPYYYKMGDSSIFRSIKFIIGGMICEVKIPISQEETENIPSKFTQNLAFVVKDKITFTPSKEDIENTPRNLQILKDTYINGFKSLMYDFLLKTEKGKYLIDNKDIFSNIYIQNSNGVWLYEFFKANKVRFIQSKTPNIYFKYDNDVLVIDTSKKNICDLEMKLGQVFKEMEYKWIERKEKQKITSFQCKLCGARDEMCLETKNIDELKKCIYLPVKTIRIEKYIDSLVKLPIYEGVRDFYKYRDDNWCKFKSGMIQGDDMLRNIFGSKRNKRRFKQFRFFRQFPIDLVRQKMRRIKNNKNVWRWYVFFIECIEWIDYCRNYIGIKDSNWFQDEEFKWMDFVGSYDKDLFYHIKKYRRENDRVE